MNAICLYFLSYIIDIKLINDKWTIVLDIGTLQCVNCVLAQIAPKMAFLTLFWESSIEVHHGGKLTQLGISVRMVYKEH
jgi:hypothetical protein